MRKCIHCEQPIILTTYDGWIHHGGKGGSNKWKLCAVTHPRFDGTEATPEPDR